jgi:hypothetical protein
VNRRGWWLIALFALGALTFAGYAEEKARNPFKVEDVQDPDGDDVKEFAKNARLAGDKEDRNAEQWVETETEGKADSLDGDWSGRWGGGSGRAKVHATKDRLFVLYTDVNDGVDGVTWLLEAVRFGKNEVRGRWVQVGNKDDTGVFYGLIVGETRIDGTWGDDARWDFRRKLKKK